MDDKLAIFGGSKTITKDEKDAFSWPQFSEEDFDAVRRVMSMPDYSFYKEAYQLEREQPAFNEANSVFPWVAKEKITPENISLPVTEKLYDTLLSLPTFPQASKELLNQYIEGFRKVIENAGELKKIDTINIVDKPDMDWSKMQMPTIR